MNLRNEPGNGDKSTVANLEGSSAHHRAIVQAHIKLPAHFEFDPALRYVSALPAQNVREYETADVRVGWRVSKALEFSVAGQNLLQRSHVEFGHNTQQPVGVERSVYGKVTWTR